MAMFCGLGPGEFEISELGARARERFIERDIASELILGKNQTRGAEGNPRAQAKRSSASI